MSEAKKPGKNSDFFLANIEDLRVGVPLPVNVWFYFMRNDHIMVWIKSGDAPPSDGMSKYPTRGLKAIWIANPDRAAWEKYKRDQEESSAQRLTSEGTPDTAAQNIEAAKKEDASVAGTTDQIQAATPELAAATQIQEATPEFAQASETPDAKAEFAPKTEAAKNILAALESTETNEKRKNAMVANEARKSIEEALTTSEVEKQHGLNEETRKAAQEILEAMNSEVAALLKDMCQLADLDPSLTHSVNVASYSVLFALGFGKVEPSLLTDLAKAGLFHDFGMSQVPAAIAQKPWSEHTPQEAQAYQSHVKLSLELARKHGAGLSERALMMIEQTHEQFNGKGYPAGVEGFKLDPSAQVLAIAELLDSIACGAFDGTQRSYQQSLQMLEQVEKNTNFPVYFNPDIFRTVLKWTKRSDGNTIAKEAMQLVQTETQQIMGGDAGGSKKTAA